MGARIHIPKEILEKFLLEGCTLKTISEKLGCGIDTIIIRCNEYGLKSKGATFHNKGTKNPSCKPENKAKISKTVTQLWKEGYYVDRKNGMAGVEGWLHHNYTGHKWTYSEYLGVFQDITTCSKCRKTDTKIDIHHVDENHLNWLVTNLEPLCVECHRKVHTEGKQPYVNLTLESHFDSAHHLLNYVGPCANSHGHRYVYKVTIRQRISVDTGMVIDFKELKTVCKNHIENILDHQYINDLVPFNTTAENLVVWIFEILSTKGLVKGLQKVELYETPQCSITVDAKDILEVLVSSRRDETELSDWGMC